MKVPRLPLDIEESFGKTQNWILNTLDSYQAEGQWLLTDLPMYAYRSGLLSPPETAAITRKRFYTGRISEADIIQTIIDYRPEQILLGRLDYPEVYEYLKNDYELSLYGSVNLLHYLLNELVY